MHTCSVLVVDGDETSRHAIGAILLGADMRATLTKDADEVVALVDSHSLSRGVSGIQRAARSDNYNIYTPDICDNDLPARRMNDIEGVSGHGCEPTSTVSEYAVALVNRELPGRTHGVELARWLRKRLPGVGIILFSSHGNTQHVAQALEEIADDYILKGLPPAELLARVHAVARRSGYPPPPPDPLLIWGPFRIDLIQNLVWVDHTRVRGLQPIQIRLLSYLIRNAGRVCTRDELRDRVFQTAQAHGCTSQSRAISILRARCGSAGKLIVTVVGVGYGIGI